MPETFLILISLCEYNYIFIWKKERKKKIGIFWGKASVHKIF